MATTKVTRNYQVTIPAEIRKVLSIKIGTIVDLIVEKGALVMRPKRLIDEDQAWFWTQEWQKGEKEAEKSIRKGDMMKFDSVEQMRKHFEK